MKIIDVSKIDANMNASGTIDKTGFDFYDIDDAPFRIYGVYRDGEKYRRLPPDIPLIPKLRGNFAEFLNKSFLARLWILSSPTCVRLRYGYLNI